MAAHSTVRHLTGGYGVLRWICDRIRTDIRGTSLRALICGDKLKTLNPTARHRAFGPLQGSGKSPGTDQTAAIASPSDGRQFTSIAWSMPTTLRLFSLPVGPFALSANDWFRRSRRGGTCEDSSVRLTENGGGRDGRTVEINQVLGDYSIRTLHLDHVLLQQWPATSSPSRTVTLKAAIGVFDHLSVLGRGVIIAQGQHRVSTTPSRSHQGNEQLSERLAKVHSNYLTL